MARLERIWIKRAKQGPMDPKDSAVLVTGEGIEGNANYGGAARQITLLGQERWAEIVAGLGVEVDPSARRANLLVSGIELAESRGKTLQIGECLVRIKGETRPCEQMDRAHQGLQAAMKANWGGGAHGEVIAGGRIDIGAPLQWRE